MGVFGTASGGMAGAIEIPPQEFDWGLGRQMAPGSPQKVHFEHLRALPNKWPQEVPRKLVLNIFRTWLPNGLGPKMLKMSLLVVSWGHLVAKAPKCSKCFEYKKNDRQNVNC